VQIGGDGAERDQEVFEVKMYKFTEYMVEETEYYFYCEDCGEESRRRNNAAKAEEIAIADGFEIRNGFLLCRDCLKKGNEIVKSNPPTNSVQIASGGSQTDE
jgi:hypothetical protein